MVRDPAKILTSKAEVVTGYRHRVWAARSRKDEAVEKEARN